MISYNRGEVVPFFGELIVPLFSDKNRNVSELMKAVIEVARKQYNSSSNPNITQQIPKLIDKVKSGARDFIPYSCSVRPDREACVSTLALVYDFPRTLQGI